MSAWSRTIPLRERVCRRLTRHRWRTVGEWVARPYMQVGPLPSVRTYGMRSWRRTVQCRLCRAEFIEWRTRDPREMS